MWIITSIGFFSVVQKKGDIDLTVRARVSDDLDQLRERYLPTLGSTKAHTGTDYPYRAMVSRAELAAAMSHMVGDIAYSNFKNAVADEQGQDRSHLYHEVWAALTKLEKQAKPTVRPGKRATAATAAPGGKRLAYGGILVDDRCRILLRKPSGEFEGYVWTFAKGGAQRGETPEQAALREVFDETGIEASIVGELPGLFESDFSATRFFLMRSVRDTGTFDRETSELIWVDLDEAVTRIGETRNAAGRKRDLSVVAALKAGRHTEARMTHD